LAKYLPHDSLSALKVGSISTDLSTIVGRDNVLFLYMGSNAYYKNYISNDLENNGIDWAELSIQRHCRLGVNTKIISLFVPNKASCMPDLYPLPLNVSPTYIWQNLKNILPSRSDFIFSDRLFENSNISNRTKNGSWRLVDSHWSEFGCLSVVNEILSRLGLDEIKCEVELIQPTLSFGDLSLKFSQIPIFEFKTAQLIDSMPRPLKSFDSGGEAPYGGHLGRRVEWTNLEAFAPLHLLIVGNSFAGAGNEKTNLTYWLARIFKKTTFLHSSYIPSNVLEFYRPDIILFQGLERFLVTVPTDDLTAQEIERLYTKTN